MLVERPLHRWLSLATALLVLSVVVACTSDDSAPPAAAVRTTVEKAWTAAGIDPVSSVQNIGGVAVVYGTTPTGLMIYGLDPATGAQLWSKPTVVPSGDSGGFVWSPQLVGTVTYFRPTDTDRLTQLVLADPETGADKAVSAARYWSTHPTTCTTDSVSVCASAYVQQSDGDWSTRTFRIDQADGETIPVSGAPAIQPDGINQLAVNDLYYTNEGTDKPEMLGRWVDDASLWSKPMSEMFGASLASPKGFWMPTDHANDLGTMIAYGEPDSGDGRASFDLATNVATSVFSLTDGSTRLISPGGWLGCGNDQMLSLTEATVDIDNKYLCRYTGSATRTVQSDFNSNLITANLNVTLERVDSATGTPTWSVDVGDARRLASDTTGAASAILDDSTIFEPNSAGGVVINLENGQTRAPTPDDIFWCLKTADFIRTEPEYNGSSPSVQGRVDGVFRACKATGENASAPSTQIPSNVGAAFDQDRQVVALAEGVTGFLVPPAPAGATGQPATDSAGPSASGTADATKSSSTPAPGASNTSAKAVEQAWAATGFEAKTMPKIIAGTAVLYGVVGADLFLIGLDPATGAERWRRKASYSAFSPDKEIQVDQIDDRVAYFRGTDPGLTVNSEIVFIDPATGIDMVATENLWWYSLPAACSDDSAQLCAFAYNLERDNTLSKRQWRIDKVTGTISLVPPESSEPGPGYTTYWNDVVTVDGAATETIGIVKDGNLVWSKSLADLAGPGATLEHGSYVGEDNGEIPVLYLSLVVGWTNPGDKYPPFDLAANTVTVGINRDNGNVLWTEPGTWVGCRDNLSDNKDMSTPGSNKPVLRCRYTGLLDSNPAGRDYGLKVPTNLSVTVERVDLQTGKAVWSLPVGAAATLAVSADGQTMTFLDDHRILIGGQIIDVDNGSTSAPAPGETFWCPSPQFYLQSNPWTGSDGSVNNEKQLNGGTFLCDSSGSPAAGSPISVPLAVSTMSDTGLRLVSTPAGVIAYRVPL